MTKPNLLLALVMGIFCAILPSNAQVTFSQESNLINPASAGGPECVVDMNGDFLDDVVRFSSSGIYIDYQQTDGSFVQQFHEVDIAYQPDWSVTAGDLDNNGFNDLLLGNGSRVTFLVANEDGTGYTADLHPEYIFSQRSTFADIDNDGNLDAFVCHDVDKSHPYRSDGNGGMTLDQTLIETVDMPGNYAAIWVDYDNDWDTDLYVTKCQLGSTPGDVERTNRMYRNNGDGTYTEAAADIGLDDNAQSWATVFEDFDNDGDFDAFIVNHDDANRFFINDGNGNYADIIDDVAIAKNDLGAWEAMSADFDNDGFVDIFSELAKEIYFNNGNMTFTGADIPVNNGALGDLNNDGFVDIVRGSTIWMNEGNDNNWLKINTIGTISNRNGIGARIEIYGEWGVQIREVRAGESFSPMSSLHTFFGIGTATEIEMVVVKWPSGLMTMIEDVEINSTITISEIDADCFGSNVIIEANGPLGICPGESVELTAPEGAGYLWTTGENTQSITVTEPGNFNVILTNPDSCISFSNNIVVSYIQDEEPTLLADGVTLFCEGGSVMLTASENPSYIWNNEEETQTIEVTESGSYFVSVPGICIDELASDVLQVEVLSAPLPEVEDVTINPGNTATLEATGNNLTWYDAETGGMTLSNDFVYETDVINETTTYWVNNTTVYPGAEQDGGKLEMDGGGGIPSVGAYNFFNVTEPFTLLSVLVNVPDISTPGIRTIQLVDNEDNVLEELEFDLDYGDHVLDLNWAIPVGEDFTLRCSENNLFRNNSGVNYPYAIGDVGELTNSFYGPQYYYYFYDWKIQKQSFECISDRVAVTVFLSGTDEQALFSNLKVFPNPTSDLLTIEYALKQQQSLQIELLDVVGKVIYSEVKNTANGNTQFEMEHLSTGVYLLQLTTDQGVVSRKVVKE